MVYKNVIRTKNSIRKAFSELIDEKEDIRKVAIKDLIVRANISKSTFYAHYSDIWDLLNEYENEAIELSIKQIKDYFNSDDASIEDCVHHLFDLFKENEALYSKLSKCNADLKIFDKLFDNTYDILFESLKKKYKNKDINVTNLKFELSFLIYGTISMLFNYFIGRFDSSLDAIENNTIRLLYNINKQIEALPDKK